MEHAGTEREPDHSSSFTRRFVRLCVGHVCHLVMNIFALVGDSDRWFEPLKSDHNRIRPMPIENLKLSNTKSRII